MADTGVVSRDVGCQTEDGFFIQNCIGSGVDKECRTPASNVDDALASDVTRLLSSLGENSGNMVKMCERFDTLSEGLIELVASVNGLLHATRGADLHSFPSDDKSDGDCRRSPVRGGDSERDEHVTEEKTTSSSSSSRQLHSSSRRVGGNRISGNDDEDHCDDVYEHYYGRPRREPDHEKRKVRRRRKPSPPRKSFWSRY